MTPHPSPTRPADGEPAEDTAAGPSSATGGSGERAAPRRRPHSREPQLSEERRQGAARALLIVASGIVVVAGLRAASTIIVPFLVAFFISVIALPLLDWLRSKKLPTGLAVLITILAVLAALSGVGFLVSGSVNELTRELPKYRGRVAQVNEQISERTRPAVEWLREHGVELPAATAGGAPPIPEDSPDSQDALPDPEAAELPAAAEESNAAWFVNLFDVDAVINRAIGAVGAVAAIVSNVVVVVLILTFILLEAATFPRKLRLAFGGVGVERRFGSMMRELRRYLGIKTAISLVTGALIAVWLSLLGVDFALLWGFVAFGLNFIPNLGSILAAIPATLLAALQLGFFPAFLVALGYLVVNMLLGNLLEPLLLGRQLGISALVVLLSLVFWGWVWGPVGMLLSVPLTMVVKIMLENTEDLQWLAVMLGDEASALRKAENGSTSRLARRRAN